MKSVFKRYIKFATVGASGALIQMGISLFLFNKYAPSRDGIAYLIGMVVILLITSAWNFAWNSVWTFRNGEKK